jgi:hypothetical protein
MRLMLCTYMQFSKRLCNRFPSLYSIDTVPLTESTHWAFMACILLRLHSSSRPSISGYRAIDPLSSQRYSTARHRRDAVGLPGLCHQGES